MRQPVLTALFMGSVVTLSACGNGNSDADVERAMQSLNVVDESNLNDLYLTAGDPDEAVAYFERASASSPDRIDLKRGLAKSLIRAGKPTEAIAILTAITQSPEAIPDDKVDLADAFIRTNEWDRAEATLAEIPPTHETFDRYRLEAMVADSKQNWDKADSFYEIAAGLTTKPAGVLNNWGFSKLSRQDYAGAEKLFMQALTYDPNLFTAKNNLVLARSAQHKYDLPVVQMTQIERAELLYTIALAAIKQGDVSVGKALLGDAIETHPQHFEAATRSLAALEG
jgi:Flp pilus assembly protein TadD